MIRWLSQAAQPESCPGLSVKPNPNGAAALRWAGKRGLEPRKIASLNADRHAQDLAPVIKDLRLKGVTSLRGIAAALTERGLLTQRGGRWHVSNVRNLMKRLQRDAELKFS
jgi:hypothetical protein